MGLKPNALSNFNVSIAVFVILPVLLGLGRIFYTKISNKNKNYEKDLEILN